MNYDIIRPLFKKISYSQLASMEAIIKEWEARELTDLRYLAYILATVFHETARTMQPVKEYGRGKGHPYGVPDPVTKKVYYGRGLVQITHAKNYQNMGNHIGVDLYHNPDAALEMGTALKILFEGMLHGMFTGKKLSDYFNDDTDWIGARKIINGTDHAELIAGYALQFHYALI